MTFPVTTRGFLVAITVLMLGQLFVQRANAQASSISIGQPTAGAVLPLKSNPTLNIFDVKGSGLYSQSGSIKIEFFAADLKTLGEPFGGTNQPANWEFSTNSPFTTAGNYIIRATLLDGSAKVVTSNDVAVSAQ